jgi:hypothetical protein
MMINEYINLVPLSLRMLMISVILMSWRCSTLLCSPWTSNRSRLTGVRPPLGHTFSRLFLSSRRYFYSHNTTRPPCSLFLSLSSSICDTEIDRNKEITSHVLQPSFHLCIYSPAPRPQPSRCPPISAIFGILNPYPA